MDGKCIRDKMYLIFDKVFLHFQETLVSCGVYYIQNLWKYCYFVSLNGLNILQAYKFICEDSANCFHTLCSRDTVRINSNQYFNLKTSTQAQESFVSTISIKVVP